MNFPISPDELSDVWEQCRKQTDILINRLNEVLINKYRKGLPVNITSVFKDIPDMPRNETIAKFLSKGWYIWYTNHMNEEAWYIDSENHNES